VKEPLTGFSGTVPTAGTLMFALIFGAGALAQRHQERDYPRRE